MRGQFPQSGESVQTLDWSARMSPASSPGSLLPKYRRLTSPLPSEPVGFSSKRTLSHISRGLRDAPQTSTFGEGEGGLGRVGAFGSAEIVTEPSPAAPPRTLQILFRDSKIIAGEGSRGVYISMKVKVSDASSCGPTKPPSSRTGTDC